MMSLNSSPRVQQNHDEAFHIRTEIWMVNDVGTPIRSRLIGSIAELHFYWRRAFPQYLNFEFLGIENVRILPLLWNVKQFQLHKGKEKKPHSISSGALAPGYARS